jgi:hypothetical protein
MKDDVRFPWFGPYDNTTCDNVIIQNNRFIGNAGTDLSNSTYYRAIGNHTYVATCTTKNIVITQNVFENLPCAIQLDDVITFNICSNVFTSCYMGIVFDHQENTTSNVVITGNKFSGIYSSTSGTYSNCRFVSINSGAKAPVTENKFIVSNNVITNCHHHGIAGTCNDIVVDGNVVDTCGRTGIFGYGGIGWNISNNRVTNCNTHAAGYQEIIVGGNVATTTPTVTPGAPVTTSIVSNNNATNIKWWDNVSSTLIIGNLCKTLVYPEGAIIKANVVNGIYVA